MNLAKTGNKGCTIPQKLPNKVEGVIQNKGVKETINGERIINLVINGFNSLE